MTTQTSSSKDVEKEGAAKPGDRLTITDNRTGRSYEVPISDGTIRATDLIRLLR